MKGTLLRAPALDVYGHMAFDDAMLASAGESLVLRFYEWPGGPRDPSSPHALSFGYSQAYEEARRDLVARGLPSTTPLARRPTGGGIVYHDREITFSLVFPWNRLAAPSLVYKDLHRGVQLGLKSHGLASRLWSPGTVTPGVPLACFTGPSPMDLVHEDGRKFMGGALRRRQGAGLYQASFRPEGFGETRDLLQRAIHDGLGLEWRALFLPAEASEELIWEAERLRGERYSRDDWNKRR